MCGIQGRQQKHYSGGWDVLETSKFRFSFITFVKYFNQGF